MSLTLFVQLFINLLILASLYTLVAVGLSLIFSVMRVVNFAHAQFYLLGAFLLYSLYGAHHLSFWPAVVIASVLVGVVGLAVQAVLVRPVQSEPLRAMTVTLGLLLVINGVLLIAYGSQTKYITEPLSGVANILGSPVPDQQLVILGITVLVVAGLAAFLKWTPAGRALRALAQDDEGAQLQGIPTQRYNALGFAVGSALAGAAGALILPVTAAVDPGSGDSMLANMFIIVVLGGLGSVAGAIVGALFLAAITTFGFQYLGNSAILVTYGLVIRWPAPG